MRSPTLLTGLTGTVAVVVLLYVGLAAMNLQPHLTFGDPSGKMASAEIAPPPAPSIPPVIAPTAPAVPTTLPAPALVPTAPSASLSPAESLTPAPAQVADKADSPTVAAAPPIAAAAAPPIVSPVTPPEIPVSSTSVRPDVVPPAFVALAVPAVTASPPSMAAAASPAGNPAPSEVAPPAATPSVPTAVPSPLPRPVIETPPLAANNPSASPEAVTAAPETASAEPATSHAAATLLSERMAASPDAPPPTPSPPTPPTPLAASVPTPLARPTPPVAEKDEKLAAAETRPLDDGPAQIDMASPPPPENKGPPTETAALTPQPDKPADGSAVVTPANGDLKPVDLSRPFAERAGILTIGGRSLQLAGLQPTDPERSCTGPNGKEWPCGTLARTALRSFLLGRTITCDVPDPGWKGVVTADCRFAKISVGDWLVRNGWAEVASGSPFTAAADEARKAGRGVYGNDPRKKHQSTLAPEPPKEDPLNPI